VRTIRCEHEDSRGLVRVVRVPIDAANKAASFKRGGGRSTEEKVPFEKIVLLHVNALNALRQPLAQTLVLLHELGLRLFCRLWRHANQHSPAPVLLTLAPLSLILLSFCFVSLLSFKAKPSRMK